MTQSKQPEDAYEAPKVEQIVAQPAVTAAGQNSGNTTTV